MSPGGRTYDGKPLEKESGSGAGVKRHPRKTGGDPGKEESVRPGRQRENQGKNPKGRKKACSMGARSGSVKKRRGWEFHDSDGWQGGEGQRRPLKDGRDNPNHWWRGPGPHHLELSQLKGTTVSSNDQEGNGRRDGEPSDPFDCSRRLGGQRQNTREKN